MNFLTLLQKTNKSEVYSCLSEMHRKPIEFVKKRYKKNNQGTLFFKSGVTGVK